MRDLGEWHHSWPNVHFYSVELSECTWIYFEDFGPIKIKIEGDKFNGKKPAGIYTI